MKRLLITVLGIAVSLYSYSQVPFPGGVLDPNKMEPWGYQKILNWNTSPYLPFKYQYRWFRLMPPNGVTYNKSTNTWAFSDLNKKYPVLLFFPGRGEQGTDNDNQLKHGGQTMMTAVQNNTFPGYLVYVQSCGDADAKKIIDHLIEKYQADPDRIYVHGLSNGGTETWKFQIHYPTTVAAAFPMSANDDDAKSLNLMYSPIRLAQGGLDTNPKASWTQTTVDYYKNNGGHLQYFFLPNTGHGTWNAMYALPDFLSWFLSKKKNQIFVRYDRNELCPEEAINVDMGFTPGFEAYEWRKDGILMAGQSSHKIIATEYGSYTGRFRRSGVWTEWSDPVVVKIKSVTITPPITLKPGSSSVIPDVNGNSVITLVQPSGYQTYEWNQVGQSEPIATTQEFIVSSPGSYTATVKEFGGCSSAPSVPFVVAPANGTPAPDPISNPVALSKSKTEIGLTWENNLTPIHNETGFEIWRSLNPSGPFDLIKVTAADVLTYSDKNLESDTWYYYLIRPISTTGAAEPSPVFGALTQVDITPPSAPGNLTVTSVSNTSIGLKWDASTDDVGVVGYDVYLRKSTDANFVKAYVTTNLSQTVFQLDPNTIYNLIVKARDERGNESVASVQIVTKTVFGGLNYSYYEGNWSALPNFALLTPRSTGWSENVPSLADPSTIKLRADQYGLSFTGFINLPTTGKYTFYTTSDDGSKLYVNGVQIVNNDGAHGAQTRSGITATLTAGSYPFKVDYFDATGTADVLTVEWAGPGISRQVIPSSYLRDNIVLPTAPSTPSGLNLVALDYKSIRVNWSVYSGTGTNIEIYRSLNNTTWSIVNTVPANTTTYTDTNLTAATRYYYRFRAISPTNVSAFSGSVNIFTATLPPPPAAPSSLAPVLNPGNIVNLAWLDNSSNEDGFEVYRSKTNNTSYALLTTTSAGVVSFNDNTALAHTTYYYKVRGKNIGGFSAYTNEVSVSTLNNAPVISGLTDMAIRFNDSRIVTVTVSDLDNDFLVIGSDNLPSFVSLSDNGDGTAILYLEPSEADLGTYTGLQVYAFDPFGGIHTVTFSLNVNTNHSPTIADVAPVSMKESYVTTINVVATDEDFDVLTWTLSDVPSFVTPIISGNTVQLLSKPDLNNAGNYTIHLSATDPVGSVATKTVTLTVEDFNPNFSVMLNFRAGYDNNSLAAAPWNNINDSEGLSTTPLIRADNSTNSGISIQVENDWNASDVNGVTPGIYPTAVNRSYFWHQENTARTLKITGLNPNGKYNFKILASRISDGANRLTSYTVSGQGTQSLQANANANTLAELNSLISNSNGELTLSIAKGAGSSYALLNALVIESVFDGYVPPVAPSALTTTVNNYKIQLNWTDNSANEQSFQVFRSADNVTFTQIGTTGFNVNTFTDANFIAGQTYYYKVLAANGIGNSPYSNMSSIVGPNQPAVVDPVPLVKMLEVDVQNVTLHAVDPDGDELSYTLENAPYFMWTEQIDNEHLDIIFAPSTGDRGTYQFLVHCDDIHGARSTATVNLIVKAPGEFEVKVNFTVNANIAAAPWNNITTYNTAGYTLSDLKDDENVTTPISVQIQNVWSGTNPNGYVSGSNSGIYPDAVTAASFFISDATVRNVVLSGLKPEKLYDFTFFASRMGVSDARVAIYSIGTKTATLNGSNNTSTTAKILGVKSNASGQVTLTVAKQSTSTFAYLNALVIREYPDNGGPVLPSPPNTLNSQVLTRNSIKLSWQDASDNETGFEIWRSSGDNSNYTLIGTSGANTTSFTNSGLNISTTYFYKIRAINAAGQSEYSNETNASTFDFSVSVNLDAWNGGPSSWNNVTTSIALGGSVTNLKDELGANTGITMTIVEPFLGENHGGMTTGNNSGIVPDQVMQGMYWIDPMGRAVVKFSNLSLLRKYNFSFFASRSGGGDRTTTYTINGTTVSLNASNNTQNIVQIKNVLPDETGSVTITVGTTASAMFGYLNGIILQAVPNNGARFVTNRKNEIVSEELLSNSTSKAYPNPFGNLLSVELSDEIADNFTVSLVNSTGKSIIEQSHTRKQGESTIFIGIPDELVEGLYILHLKDERGRRETLKLYKK